MPRDEAYVTSGVQDTVVAVWCGDPTGTRVQGLADHLRQVAASSGAPVFLFNVITWSTPVPASEARGVLQVQFDSMRGQVGAAAIVLEKTGLEGSLSRTVLSTLVTITKRPFPMRIFAVRRDAAQWLRSNGCAASPQTLLALAESLEAKLIPAAPAHSGS